MRSRAPDTLNATQTCKWAIVEEDMASDPDSASRHQQIAWLDGEESLTWLYCCCGEGRVEYWGTGGGGAEYCGCWGGGACGPGYWGATWPMHAHSRHDRQCVFIRLLHYNCSSIGLLFSKVVAATQYDQAADRIQEE